MEKTGKKEHENVENIYKNGYRWFIVYVHGGWSKRSYGQKYNAASSVVSNINLEKIIK